ncbi:MAG TPA: hypothetical protein DEQ47_15695 [Solibacterales bacterium]|nr:hypothetical protein [Bryobacterales bacterium]
MLAYCLEGRDVPDALLDPLLDAECSPELFRTVIERLADLFEPRLCLVYARLFSRIMARALPEFDAGELFARYQRVRVPQVFEGAEPEQVYVLSRVTLGADIAVTSVFLEAARRRFPRARVFLAGGAKSAQLFEGAPWIEHLPVNYPSGGSLAQRLEARHALQDELSAPGALVIDPDSRLTQLGLLPVCAEPEYLFFESRAYGGDGDENLGTLARRWCREVLSVDVNSAVLQPRPVAMDVMKDSAAVSLGVGDNAAKRLDGAFEAGLLRELGQRFASIVIDRGLGTDEGARVDHALAASGLAPERFVIWNGSFAGFVSLLARCRFYAGYDSAGQHAAAACGVPLVTIFKGYASERMLARWRPAGPGVTVIPVREPDDSETILQRVRERLP